MRKINCFTAILIVISAIMLSSCKSTKSPFDLDKYGEQLRAQNVALNDVEIVRDYIVVHFTYGGLSGDKMLTDTKQLSSDLDAMFKPLCDYDVPYSLAVVYADGTHAEGSQAKLQDYCAGKITRQDVFAVFELSPATIGATSTQPSMYLLQAVALITVGVGGWLFTRRSRKNTR